MAFCPPARYRIGECPTPAHGNGDVSFYFNYGSYNSLACSARCSSHAIRPLFINNFAVAHQHDVTIEGTLYVTSDLVTPAANLITECGLLEDALKIPNQSGGLKYSGGNTTHFLSNSGAIGGVTVSDFRWVDTPTHLVTQARFTVTLSALYGNGSEAREVVEANETVEILGEGGADTPLAPQTGATSVRQQITDYTDVVVTQSGRLVGRTGYPSLPSPLIATAGARQQKMTRDAKTTEQRGVGFIAYIRSYSYTFTLATHPGTVNPNFLT